MQFVILVPVVLGLVEAVKQAGMPSRYAPILALSLGVAGTFLMSGDYAGASVIQGLIVGLSAVGLWSGVKSSILGQ